MSRSKRTNLPLEQLNPLWLEECNSLDDLLSSLATTSFGARDLGRAWAVLKHVLEDRECALLLTISGAMTIAKLSHTFGSLVSRTAVNAIVTTGAVVTHSLVEEIGLHHYRVPPTLDDGVLYDRKLNRIYDAVEKEDSLNRLEELSVEAFSKFPPGDYGSSEIIERLSAEVLTDSQLSGLLGSALKHNVKVYVPALVDSEIGLYLFRFLDHFPKKIRYDPLIDLDNYRRWILSHKRIAFLTLGGGVPRNWAQQMLPFLRSNATETNGELPKVVAAVRVCPDPAFFGHLSGSTYSEGISWGKFDWEDKKNLVEVHCDATIAFPFLAKAMLEYLDRV
jgi:deoxyhypusine synthase